MKLIQFFIRVSVFLLSTALIGCASVKMNSTPMGDDKFLITCDGNGYASTGDTMQCAARAANSICNPLGKSFRIIDAKTDSQLHVGVNLANGNPVPHMRPHSAAIVECVGEANIPTSANTATLPSALSSNSVTIAPDLSVADSWFFSGKGLSRESAANVSESRTSSRKVKVGENFGVGLKFASSREKVKIRVELHVPNSPERFPAHSGRVSIGADKRTVIVDYEVPGAKGKFGHYWGFGQGDPVGRYELKVYVEDVPIETFTFEAQDG